MTCTTCSVSYTKSLSATRTWLHTVLSELYDLLSKNPSATRLYVLYDLLSKLHKELISNCMTVELALVYELPAAKLLIDLYPPLISLKDAGLDLDLRYIENILTNYDSQRLQISESS